MSVAGVIVFTMKSARFPETGRLAGVVTAAELVHAGFSRKAIQVMVSRGDLLSIRRGAYAKTDLVARLPGAREFRQRAIGIAAAVAVSGPGAVASGQDAALLHGLDLLERPPNLISVSRRGGHDRVLTGRPTVRVRATSLPRSHVTIRSGVPVTSVARTVVDLARTTSFQSGVVVADSALYRSKMSNADLDEVITTCRHWPGIDRARRVATFCDGKSESPFESIARVAFREGGLPPPELQVWVGGDDGPVGRADFLWRQQRTIAEADGAIKYADPDRARQQLHRDADLRDAGFEVVHFSWRELANSPGQVITRIRTAFARTDALRRDG